MTQKIQTTHYQQPTKYEVSASWKPLFISEHFEFLSWTLKFLPTISVCIPHLKSSVTLGNHYIKQNIIQAELESGFSYHTLTFWLPPLSFFFWRNISIEIRFSAGSDKYSIPYSLASSLSVMPYTFIKVRIRLWNWLYKRTMAVPQWRAV